MRTFRSNCGPRDRRGFESKDMATGTTAEGKGGRGQEGERGRSMSQKTRIYKKVHKEIRKQKPALINQIARELLTQPLRERLRLAWKIVKG
jgi:hypothetical protein